MAGVAPVASPSPSTLLRVEVPRRQFLTWMVRGTTLAVAARIGGDVLAPASARADVLDPGELLTLSGLLTSLDLRIAVTTENRIVVTLPRIECGQGITTTIAMLVAEEMDARLEDVDVALADATPSEIFQLTGLSNSVRSLTAPTRAAAASARARLVTAAAQKWALPPSSLSTADTHVVAPDGRAAAYGSLSGAAAGILVPAVSPSPKPASRFRLIGRPTTRIDARDIVTGRVRYGMDLTVEGALPTVVLRPPTIGGRVGAFDAAVARAMPGVVAVIAIPSGVAVAARTFHEAVAARDAVSASWLAGPAAGLSDASIRARLAAAAPPFLFGPLFTARTLDFTFDFPYLPHAPLEVQNCVADVRPGSSELWIAAQDALGCQRDVAAALGRSVSSVTVHIVRAGGAFGRRLFHEPAIEAALVSRAIGRPVRLLWTRNDDMRHGRFRPTSHHRIRTYLSASGAVLAHRHRVMAPVLDLSHGVGDAVTALVSGVLPSALSQAFFHLTQKVPYDFSGIEQTLVEVPTPIPTGSWRSVYSSQVVVANEIVIDEIAAALGRDPVEYRRSRLSSSRVRGVLETVVREGRWGRHLPPRHAQGVAVHEEYDSAVAHLVEIDAGASEPRVMRVVVAADVGLAINPRGVEAQLQGATLDAISTTFRAGVHVDQGAIREGSYADYRFARMRNSPLEIAVHVAPSTGEVGGVGELAYPSAAAALANAYSRATGARARRFPLLDPVHQGA